MRYFTFRPGRTAAVAGCLLLSCVTSDLRKAKTISLQAPALPPQAEAEKYTYDLSRVAGIDNIPQDRGLRKLLAQNGFVVVPRQHPQIFSPYLHGELPYLPAFVTVDSALRTYQVLLQEGLRLIERAQAARLVELSTRLLVDLKALNLGRDPVWEQTRLKLLAWAAVGLRLQENERGFEDLPEGARTLASAEWRAIEKGGVAATTIVKRRKPMQYGHLEATGFYAQEKSLADFFRAVKWYGLTSFRIKAVAEVPCALLLASTFAADPKLLEMIQAFMAPYDALLGPPDDVGVLEAVRVLTTLPREKGIGAGYTATLPSFRTAMNALPRPRINDQILDQGTYVTAFDRVTHGLRLLPPRYTWEAHLGTKLGTGRGRQDLLRPLYVSLALGDPRSETILRRTDAPETVDWTKKSGNDCWRSAPPSLYRSSLAVLSKVFDPPPKQAPRFAHTDAWKTKATWTGLAGWTCLRHLWELHAKELAVISGLVEGLEPAGYVSPYPAVFEGLGELARQTDRVLAACGGYDTKPVKEDGIHYMPPPKDVKDRIEKFVRLMDHVASIARRQLRGEVVTKEENELLFSYGSKLGHLHFYPSNMYMKPYDDMPQAVLYLTDATGSPPMEHYAAVGRAFEIYLIREDPGGLRLYRGATFSFYDFAQRSGKTRLTDVQWKELLDSDRPPDTPAWAADFTVPIRTSDIDRLRAGEYIEGIEKKKSPELTEAALEGYFKARIPGSLWWQRWSGTSHLRIFLAGIRPENTDRLIDLAPRIDEPQHLYLLAKKLEEAAPGRVKRRLLAEAARGHSHLLVLAWHLVDKSLPLEQLKAIFGNSKVGRWALAAALGEHPEPQQSVEINEGGFVDEEEEGLDPDILQPPPPSEIETERARELLRLAREDEDYLVRAQAMRSLGYAPRTNALPVLRKGLADPSPAVRTCAALSLLKHDDARSEPLIVGALWYIDDPLNRQRTKEEGDCLVACQEFLGSDVPIRVYGQEEASPLVRLLLHELPEGDSGSWHSTFAAARFVEDPTSFHWTPWTGGDTKRCWHRLLIAIATDEQAPLQHRDNAFSELRFGKPDSSTARALAPSLDDATVLGNGCSAAALAAQVIILAVEGDKEVIQLETPADRQIAIQRARKALEKLDRAREGWEHPNDDEELQADLEELEESLR